MLEVHQKQTAKFLKSKILEILAKYGISVDRLFCVTCDNGANMIAAVRELKKEFDLLLNGELTDDLDDADEREWTVLRGVLSEFKDSVNLIRCGVHTLQLAVTDVTKNYKDQIGLVSEITKNCRKVMYKSQFEKCPLPPQYCRTRWGGVFEMLSSFFEHQDLHRDLGERFPELALTDDSWLFIQRYVAAFKPLFICTKKMQASHVGLSDFVMAWYDASWQVATVENDIAKELQAAMKKRLNVLMQSMPLKAALYMDPRFNYLDSTLFDKEEKMEIRNFIKQTYQRLEAISDKLKQPITPNSNSEQQQSGFDDFLLGMFGGQPSTSRGGGHRSLEEQISSLDAELRQIHTLNIWDYWQSRKTTHPQLYEVASLIYAVPSNQVSVERAFSALRLVLSDQRTSLGEDTLETIMLLKLNFDLFLKVLEELTADE